ncbi:MAG TPA: hypothetical protein VKX17_18750 [Planctomycetota bacterium]|nr:hypothetical protein [Planctomycetota bacterium]
MSNLRLHSKLSLAFCLTTILVLSTAAARAAGEEPQAGYVPDPAIEQVIETALSTDKAIAFPAMKQLASMGSRAERALNYRLFTETSANGRRQYAELIARCGTGRVGYRVTLDLAADGSGKLLLESDRSMIADCARKSDRIFQKPPREISDKELRRNPYAKADLLKSMENSVQYLQGGVIDDKDGNVVASGELMFNNFDDFAAFASDFDKTGYHMLNGISLSDSNGARVLHMSKAAETDKPQATRYLLLFHDLKWEFVLNFKGTVKSHNATRAEGNKLIWRFDCAQMLNGETEIEVAFDPKALNAPTNGTSDANPPRSTRTRPAQDETPQPDATGLTAIPASKLINVKQALHVEPGQQNPNGPETILTLDGSPSFPKDPELKYQWVQTSGRSLNLPRESLAKRQIRMRIFEPGRYTFELTVSRNGVESAPAEVVVMVGDSGEAVASADPLNKTVTLPPRHADKTSSDELATPKVRPPSPPPEVDREDRRPKVENSKPRPGMEGIALDEIRMEETAYNRRVAAIKNGMNPDATEAFVPPLPVHPKLENQGTEVAVTKIATDDIRREEAVFNQAHSKPIVRDVPAAPPVRQVAPPQQKIDVDVSPPVIPKKDEAPVEPKPPVEPRKEETVVVKKDVKVEPTQPEFSPAEKSVEPKTVVKVEPKKDVKPPETPATPPVVEPKKDAPALVKVDPKKDVKPPETPVTPPVVAEKKIETPAVAKNDAKAEVKPPEISHDAAPPVESKKVEPAAPALAGDPVQQGIQLMKQGDNAAAVAILTKALKAKPNDEALTLNLGIALFESGTTADDFDRAATTAALDRFTEVIQVNDQNVAALMYAGHCNMRLDRAQQARAFYMQGYSLGKEKVGWESKWQLGEKYLVKAKDYDGAVQQLLAAEKDAEGAGVKDARLLRDLAASFHGLKKDDEAVKRINALVELGYTPDVKLVAELQKGPHAAALKLPGAAPKPEAPVAVKDTKNEVNTTAFIPPAPGTDDVKKVQPAKVVDAAPKANEKSVPTTTTDTPKTDVSPIKTGSAIKEVANATQSAAANLTGQQTPPAKKEEVKTVERPKTPRPTMTVKDLENDNSEKVTPAVRPPQVAGQAAAPKEPLRDPVQKVKVMPPVPAKFEDALAAGKIALEKGNLLVTAAATPEAKDAAKKAAQDYWDEAELMFRGALALKPDDAEVRTQFEELAKQVGVIALVKDSYLTSKPKGLVVLNAEPSIIIPKEKPMWYAWEQVEGKDLGLRREEMDKKMVGLKIRIPGVYKFELTVSDGSRGGNPVTVTVEVRE